MKIVIILISIVLPFSGIGQQTKKINNKKSKEVYYVLKTDKTKRQGIYKKFGCGDQVVVEGYYENGLKDSVWREYQATGSYSEGKRVRVWDFYCFNGELEQKYDYTNDTLLFYLIDDSISKKEYKIIAGPDTLRSQLDRPPLYIGGTASFISYIANYNFN